MKKFAVLLLSGLICAAFSATAPAQDRYERYERYPAGGPPPPPRGVPAPPPLPPGYSNTKELGRLVYTEYVYAFEIAAAILLVAIVAAIAITLRHRKETKYVNPADQVSVRRDDRVRIVKMRAEPRERETR